MVSKTNIDKNSNNVSIGVLLDLVYQV